MAAEKVILCVVFEEFSEPDEIGTNTVFNPIIVFGLLAHLWCSRSKMTGLQTTAYKSVIMLYYH